MFSKRSIRRRFLLQLIIASAALIVLFSSFLYLFIKQSIYDEKQTELLTKAQNISDSKSITALQQQPSDQSSGLTIDLITLQKSEGYLEFFEVTRQDVTTLTDRKSVV